MASHVPANVAANLLGRVWAALVGLAFVPAHLAYLGAEAYGVVGLFASLLALSAILDLGASATLNREIARGVADPSAARSLVRTLGMVQWTSAVALGLCVAAAAPWISGSWLRTDELPAAEVERALILMGGVLALQLPTNFYVSGLLGLQSQVTASLLNAAFATARAGGAVLALRWGAPTLGVFFAWQLAVGACHLAAVRIALMRGLPRGRGRFDGPTLARVWRFAAGVSGITVLLLLMSQLDRILLSRLLPLEEFGHYALAALLAQGLQVVVHPFSVATFPRLSELVARGEEARLRDVYHAVSQALAATLLSIAAVLALNADSVLLLWTGDPALAERTAPVLATLVAGTALHGLANMPHALQLAYGMTGFALRAILAGTALLVPLLLASIHLLGALGGGLAWALLNLAYLLAVLPAMHRRVLRHELRRWYVHDVLRPLAAVSVVAVGTGALVPPASSPVSELLRLSAIMAMTLAAGVLAAPRLRSLVVGRLVASVATRPRPKGGGRSGAG